MMVHIYYLAFSIEEKCPAVDKAPYASKQGSAFQPGLIHKSENMVLVPAILFASFGVLMLSVIVLLLTLVCFSEI